MIKIDDRNGEIALSNEGLKMLIKEYRKYSDVDIEFENGYFVKNQTYGNFQKGNIKNPYHPSVCGVGYIGEGKYRVWKFGKNTIQYNMWRSMLCRCYDEKIHKNRLTYLDCKVCEEWYNFQIFSEWFDNNYYEIENEKMALDKDILIKWNKVYSPKTCVFVPETINVLFTKRQNYRGDYPIGVSFDGKTNKFKSKVSEYGKIINLGYFDTTKEAFEKYKREKEKHIKEVADEYKFKIPQKLYDALYKYEVEITD